MNLCNEIKVKELQAESEEILLTKRKRGKRPRESTRTDNVLRSSKRKR